ncbi:MAG: hypothetical protein KDE58_05345, partial [Caldilineaceae bacterium]|nr:hypothetical protein [Caldilineaceae bacterium]
AYFPLDLSSIAVDAGDNALAVDQSGNPLATDQVGNPRLQGRAVDLGAYETVGVPSVTIAPESVNANEGAGADLTITRDGDLSAALDVTVNISRGADVTAGDYSFSGALSGTPEGAQSVTIPAGEAAVTLNVAALSDAVGAEADETITIALVDELTYNLYPQNTAIMTILAHSLDVTNLNDSGEGTLRQAILNANAFSSDDTITFGVSGMIAAGAQQYTIENNGKLTIDGGGAITVNRSFSVKAGANATLAGLNISNSGVYNDGGTLTVSRSTIDGAFTSAASGAGIFNNNGILIVRDSTLSNNYAADGGGGIYFNGGSGTIINSTFFGNSGGDSGGSALYIRNGASVMATNSTFAESGSFQVLLRDDSTLSLNNSIIAGNLSPLCTGLVTVQNSLIQDGSCGITNGV